MTQWGSWSSNGHTQLGVDWSYSGNTLNVTVSLATHWSFSNNGPMTLAYSGSWGGSVNPGNITRSNPSSGAIWSGSFTQGYNTTGTLTFTLSGFYDGSGSNCSVTFNPYLPPLAPAAPTFGTATRISDAQINLTWTDNPTGSAPYDNVYVYRDDNTVGTSLVGALGGSAASFSDTGLVADRRFRYQIGCANATGSAYSAWSSYVYTTPADPTSCAAVKSGTGDITVTWTNTSTYAAETPVEVWHAANGVWDGAALTTISAGAAASYVHTAPSPSMAHQYRVRAKSPTGSLYSGYSTSGVVQLLARPNAPTGLTQTSAQQSGSTVDASYATTLAFTHNPVDSSAMTAYEIQYQMSTDSAGTVWGSFVSTGKITSSTASRVYAAATWTNKRAVRWQVRTWGAYNGTAPTYSDWSSLSTFWTSATPTGTLTGSGTCTSSVLIGTAAYFDAEGSAQTGARWTLRTMGGTVLETVTFGPADSAKFLTYTFSTVVQDATSYVVAYQAQDGAGLWSVEATKTVAVAYAKPATPSLVVSYSDVTGAVSGTVTNPVPGAEPAAVYNVIYRNGVPLMALSSVLVNGSFTDPVPPLNQAVVYTVVAVSALPSVSVTSAGATATTTSSKIWINGGPGMSVSVGLQYLPQVQGTPSRDRAWKDYAGRPDEVLYVGVNRMKKYRVSGLVPPADLATLEALEGMKEASCYRDPRGRRDFVGIESFQFSDGAGDAILQPVVLQLRRCGYSE